MRKYRPAVIIPVKSPRIATTTTTTTTTGLTEVAQTDRPFGIFQFPSEDEFACSCFSQLSSYSTIIPSPLKRRQDERRDGTGRDDTRRDDATLHDTIHTILYSTHPPSSPPKIEKKNFISPHPQWRPRSRAPRSPSHTHSTYATGSTRIAW